MKVVTSAAATIVTETISGVDTTTEFESSSVDTGEWKGGYQSILTRCPTTRKAIQSSVAI
jgi:hypothetical protein